MDNLIQLLGIAGLLVLPPIAFFAILAERDRRDAKKRASETADALAFAERFFDEANRRADRNAREVMGSAKSFMEG
ncbi:MAG: hypothetical protein IJL06_05825 [Kiritimatiellae bacterium]|nr:hypothetical protein [Kiritimatiellia bacterium]